MFISCEAELLELALRIMSDSGPSKIADAVLMYGETESNESSTMFSVSELLKAGLSEKVAFSFGSKLISGQDWSPDYLAKLRKLGVPQKAIVPVQITSKLANTTTEALSFVSYAKKQKWERVYVTASPFHQIRAFIDTVSAVVRKYPRLKVFSRPGKPLNWTEDAVHSQNVVKNVRFKLIEHEWNRILAYHEKGDLLPARRVLDYLNNRNDR